MTSVSESWVLRNCQLTTFERFRALTRINQFGSRLGVTGSKFRQPHESRTRLVRLIVRVRTGSTGQTN